MAEFDPKKLEAARSARFDPSKLDAVKKPHVSSSGQPIYPQTPETGAMGSAVEAVGSALESPIPGVGGALESVKGGLESASSRAQNFYKDIGVPGVGKAVGTGGRILASAIPSKMKDALFIAAAGPVIEGAGMLARTAPAQYMLGGAGNVLADVAAAVAGKDPEVIKAMVREPGAIWSKATELFSLQHQKALTAAIKGGVDELGAKVGAIEDAFAGYHGTASAGTAPKVKLDGVFNDTVGEMLKRGHRLPEDLTGIPAVEHGRIPHNTSEYRAIIDKLIQIKSKSELDWGEALNLRRNVGKLLDDGVEGSNGLQPLSGEADRVMRGIYNRINKELRSNLPKDVIPEWDAANAAYSKGRTAYNELRKQVLGMTPQQTENKLLQLIHEGRYDDEVARRAQDLGQKTMKALDDVRDHISAKQFKKWVSRGHAASGDLPETLPGFPRIAGYAASAAGGLGRLAEGIAQRPVSGILGARAASGILPPTPSLPPRPGGR